MPETSPIKGVAYLVHGLGEHSGQYEFVERFFHVIHIEPGKEEVIDYMIHWLEGLILFPLDKHRRL